MKLKTKIKCWIKVLVLTNEEATVLLQHSMNKLDETVDNFERPCNK